jgi:RHH-type proline utilization regulon transcriptional repressor/proline dehydrogenase/delta 1-pyrroline-5-carboxylate dehydrogenase
VGNVYINRNMIGAVVGVQPFGGEGPVGTGPKAGGPHYLIPLLAAEQTVSPLTSSP